MDGPRDFHTEWSQSDREKQMSCDVAYVWSLKKKVQIDLFIYKNKVADIEKITVTGEEREG